MTSTTSWGSGVAKSHYLKSFHENDDSSLKASFWVFGFVLGQNVYSLELRFAADYFRCHASLIGIFYGQWLYEI